MASNDGCMEKESAVMRPDSLVSLSEMIMTKGLTRPLTAKPGIAANASLASPSMEAPSDMSSTVTRLFPASLSPMAKP